MRNLEGRAQGGRLVSKTDRAEFESLVPREQMKLKAAIQEFAHELDAQDNAAYDLWTWLPSCKAAQEHHGDYHAEFMPSLSEILIEAANYVADLVNGKIPATAACPCDDESCEGSKEPE